MRPAYGTPTLVPSFSLLRFLKCQAQESCFFSSSSNSIALCHGANSRPTQRFSYQLKLDAYPSSSRTFTTSQSYHANVESPRLAPDFLQPAPKTNLPSFAALGRHNASVSYWSSGNVNGFRHASIDFHQIWRRLRRSNERTDRPGLKPNDLPPIPSFLEDANGPVLGRSKVGKGANELKLRCTELNKNGRVTTVNRQFKKSELIAKVSLPRYASKDTYKS